MSGAERVVIVGGGPAGLSAARAYRESGGEGSVTILTAENFLPYRRPPLTKEYLRGEIQREELPMEEAGWFGENKVDLRLATRAARLDPERKKIETGSGEELSYDACVLATGSEPLRLPVPGGDDPGISVMRTVEDSTVLRERIGRGDRVVVVGSGFIGCEAAASLSLVGAEVVVISLEDLPQGERLGREVGERIKGWLSGYGVALRLGTGLGEIEHGSSDYGVTIESGEEFRAAAVLFGTGIQPRLGLAEEAGVKLASGGVRTDSSMRTNTPGIFAAGDIAYAFNEAAGRHLRVEHWGDALGHGRVAGTVIAGGKAVWETAPGFWSTIGDKTLKYAAWGDGWDEVRLVDHGDGAFTAWYVRDGICVGVLTHGADEDYEEGRKLVESKAPPP